MKIVQINTFPYKATGSIMMNIHHTLLSEGYDSFVCWGRGRKSENNTEIVISDCIGTKIHGVYTRLFDRTGFASNRATRNLINQLNKIQPDIIHLHNIHGYYINIEMLFDYIRKNNIRVVWTLHDCWPLTGHCSWFDMCGCEKWRTGCNHCEQLATYPASKFLDNSNNNWKKKKELFTGLDIEIVTPSEWLANLVRQSILKEYPVKVLYNGIDLSVFRPDHSINIREKYSLNNRPIILGVASEWTPRKGLNDFIELSHRMDDVQFVVVGLDEKQLNEMPKTIVGLKRTNNVNELIALYSEANVFFNPTYEDNFPTTNLEALACGIPVVTYDTGGSPEAITEGKRVVTGYIGAVVSKKNSKTVDIQSVEKVLYEALAISVSDVNGRTKDQVANNCMLAASQFGIGNRLRQYLDVYNSIL